MRKNFNKLKLIIISLLPVLLISSCAKPQKVFKADADSLKVYFVNNDANQVLEEDAGMSLDRADTESLVKRLEDGPENEDCEKILGGKTELLDYTIDDTKVLNLNFDENYEKLGKAEEVLFRMSLVNTFSQLDDVIYLSVSVNSIPLKLDDGSEVGLMSEHSFIENAGKEISAYSKTTLHLYFADSSGTKLIRTEKSLVYSSNIAMEKLVIDNLIAGPDDSSVYPTVSPDTKVNNIDIRDGICYCDLDSAIIDQANNVTEEAAFYSLVNSLCEVRGVNKVQISIDGETDRVFKEKIRLDRPYTRSSSIERK